MRATFRSWRSRPCLLVNFVWIDFGARPLQQRACDLPARWRRKRFARALSAQRIDLRSPLITGLSLSLLLRANEPWLPALAGVIAIASKFLLRIDGKHIWNPAGFAIVVLLVDIAAACGFRPANGAPASGSRTAGRFFAILVLQAAQRADIALFFLGSHAALLIGRARLARRSARHSAASDAERFAADLRLLHDLRSAHHAGFAARPFAVRLGRGGAWRTTSPSSCRCGRRFMWP